MQEKLIKLIEEGSKEERDKAAGEICQRRLTKHLDDILLMLVNSDENVRETAVMILSVIGDEKSLMRLNEISKNDPATNVRVSLPWNSASWPVSLAFT